MSRYAGIRRAGRSGGGASRMRVGASVIVAALIVVGCSSSDGDSASGDSTGPATTPSLLEDGSTPVNEVGASGFSVNDEPDSVSTEVEQVPPDEVVTEGTPPPTFVYTEDIKPDDALAATLCNLNSTFLRSLRSEDAAGNPIIDDNLRLAVLSLGDSVSMWRDLELSFPDTAEDVARADQIRELWDAALLARENGQDADAAKSMELAEDTIGELPSLSPTGVGECEP